MAIPAFDVSLEVRGAEQVPPQVPVDQVPPALAFTGFPLLLLVALMLLLLSTGLSMLAASRQRAGAATGKGV